MAVLPNFNFEITCEFYHLSFSSFLFALLEFIFLTKEEKDRLVNSWAKLERLNKECDEKNIHDEAERLDYISNGMARAD